jgi:4-hydroxy-tetrahydrodipicolinate synthase
MSINLEGTYAATITPFDDEGKLGLDQLAAHLYQLARRGCHGVLLSGTTGEGMSMSVAERIALFEFAVNANTGLRLLAGTGSAGLEDVVALTRAAFDYGVDGVVIIPPFFYLDPPLKGLIQFYAEVIQRAVPEDGAVLLYHNPWVAGCGVAPGLIARLRDRFPKQVIGIKDSSRDWEHAQTLIKAFPGFQVLVGDDALLAGNLEAGGVGAITGMANLFPDLLRDVFDAKREGTSPDDAQARLVDACHKLDGLPRIPAIKTLLVADKVIATNRVRPPLTQMSESEFEELKKRFGLRDGMP